MPLLLIFVLAISLGEGYERLRITIVDLDQGYKERDPERGNPKTGNSAPLVKSC